LFTLSFFHYKSELLEPEAEAAKENAIEKGKEDMKISSKAAQEKKYRHFEQFLQENYPKDYFNLYGFHCSKENYYKEKYFHALSSQSSQSHDQEWIQYLKAIGGIRNIKPSGKFHPCEKQLKDLVRKGIPVAYRAQIWPRISLSTRYRLQFPQGYYKELLNQSKTHLSSEIQEDIQKDLERLVVLLDCVFCLIFFYRRTFPNHPYFSHANEKGLNALENVLSSFAMHFKNTIGYCQSLNFLAGTMLLFLSDEEAFWLLATVVDKLLPADYYSKSMIGSYTDQLLVTQFMMKYLPQLNS
jgi:regulator of sigma D